MFLNRMLDMRNRNSPFAALQISPSLIENVIKKTCVLKPAPHLFFNKDNYTFPSKNNTENNNPGDKIPYYLVVTVVFVVSGYAFYYFFKKK
uniref:Uncharacterized protein n=1 Tax=viral metagenome TaxID=1070528 RepID=A0A6C0LMR6_9ZZZZ